MVTARQGPELALSRPWLVNWKGWGPERVTKLGLERSYGSRDVEMSLGLAVYCCSAVVWVKGTSSTQRWPNNKQCSGAALLLGLQSGPCPTLTSAYIVRCFV